MDIFPARSVENGRRIVSALIKLGFEIDSALEAEIVHGKDFVQIKTGPFDVDLVYAPDGIDNFAEAKARSLNVEGFRVANLRSDIQRLEAENVRLRGEIESVRRSSYAVERIAREELGMSKRGEIVYLLPKK